MIPDRCSGLSRFGSNPLPFCLNSSCSSGQESPKRLQPTTSSPLEPTELFTFRIGYGVTLQRTAISTTLQSWQVSYRQFCIRTSFGFITRSTSSHSQYHLPSHPRGNANGLLAGSSKAKSSTSQYRIRKRDTVLVGGDGPLNSDFRIRAHGGLAILV